MQHTKDNPKNAKAHINPQQLESLTKELVNFLQVEVEKRGFKQVVFGLSGGMDSALVALLCKRAFGENLKALLMPSQTSLQENIQDALNFCKTFNLPYKLQSIATMQQDFIKELEIADLVRIGNICARLRMIMLYDYAAQSNSLVIGTSNKSELMLGYGTIFGDLACAINPLGNLFKSEVFTLGEFLGVPSYILEKAPSADLFKGQSDAGDLGYLYAELDPVLWELNEILQGGGDLDSKGIENQMLQKGFEKNLIKKCINLYFKNKFKLDLPTIPTRTKGIGKVFFKVTD